MSKRLRAYVVDTAVAAKVLITSNTAQVKGAPEDAEFVRFFEDNFSGELVFIFSHPDWPEVQKGERIPRFECIFNGQEPPHALQRCDTCWMLAEPGTTEFTQAVDVLGKEVSICRRCWSTD